jgi:hypothetical protein
MSPSVTAPAERLTSIVQTAIAHIGHGEREDALGLVRSVLEDYQPTGHTGSWLRSGAELLAFPVWGEHYDTAGAVRCLQAALEFDGIADDLTAVHDAQ